MTAQEYAAQNALGFEGDTFLKAEFERLIKKHSIERIVETGTYLGATTRQFAKMAKEVYTVEVKPEYYNEAKISLAQTPNVVQFLGNSIHVLPRIINDLGVKQNVLFFLDAHWNDYNPLLEELKTIADAGIKPVIVIHDFKVRTRPELGYDSYNGQDYEWEWIATSVQSIYGVNGYKHHYNSEATGAKRGVIFIEPLEYADRGA